jgi:hypothetical protein
VLLNLMGNAVKFTDHGQVGMRVRSVPVDASQVKLTFEVRDTGVGIPQEQLETIFQPFEQVGDVGRRFGGTGLGLSISRQLVRLMNSDIHVASQPGKGSVFSFEIQVPVAQTEMAKEAAPQPAQPVVSTLEDDDLPVPPQKEMDALYELALAGNMRDIRRFAVHLAELDQRYSPLADKLLLLASEYQSKAIVSLAEKYVVRSRKT